jgi:hypothetical protein
MSTQLPLKLETLPSNFHKDGCISIELIEKVPIFRASNKVQNRIDYLLQKQHNFLLNIEEEQELNYYEQLDDYLSLVNRIIRNLYAE